MDLNNLKKINDLEEHQKGDEFILFFAEEIIKGKSKRTNFYRIGGDEFALVCKNMNEKYVIDKMERLEEHLNSRGYSFAYGLTKLQKKADIEECMLLADQLMYQKKSEMKEKKKV